MPKKPNKIQRAYLPERKPFERSMDNTWFYNSWKWRKFRKGFIRRNPLCVVCEAEGITTTATVCDHKEQYNPHAKGWDLNKLKDEDYNAMCETHHNSKSGMQSHGLRGMG